MTKSLSRKSIILTILGIFSLLTFVGSPAYADTNKSAWSNGKWENHMRMGSPKANHPIVVGSVTSISGNSMVVSGQAGFATSTSPVTYNVDISNAKIFKNNATSTANSILVGDKVAIQGQITGSSVVATIVRDGAMGLGMGQGKRETDERKMQFDNGQPFIKGVISSINGSTLSITTNGTTTYSVDTSSSKIMRNGGTITVGDLKNGDLVIIQGDISGTAIKANTIVIHSPMNKGNELSENKERHKNIFTDIGQFFSKFFGKK